MSRINYATRVCMLHELTSKYQFPHCEQLTLLALLAVAASNVCHGIISILYRLSKMCVIIFGAAVFFVLLVQLCAAYLYTVLYCGNKAQTTTMKQKTLPKKKTINTILFLRIGPYFVSTNQAAAFFASVAVIWRQAHILP